MKFQKNNWSCGPYAIYNSLLTIGVKVSVKELHKLCKTSKKTGTNEFQMSKALRKLGFKPKLHTFQSFEDFEANKKSFAVPAICCVDNYSHWVVLLGQLYDRYLVLDSLKGFISYNKKEWKKRWQAKDRAFFALTFLF